MNSKQQTYTDCDRVESKGKLKQTTRQASVIYVYIK